MNEETLRRWMREIEIRRGSAGPPRMGPGGFFAGGGLALLILGGLAVNASLFTGQFYRCFIVHWRLIQIVCSRWGSSCDQIHEVSLDACNGRSLLTYL